MPESDSRRPSRFGAAGSSNIAANANSANRRSCDGLKAVSSVRMTTTPSGQLRLLSGDQLRDHLERKEDRSDVMLVLDCRSFLAFNECRVATSVNAYCPSILRRRARGKLPLNVLVPSAEVRDRLARGHYSAALLYDESGASCREGTTAGEEQPTAMRVVSRTLLQEGYLKNIFCLEGGFQRFRARFPHLCVHTSYATNTPSPTGWRHSPSPTSAMSAGAPPYEQGDPVEILPHLYLGSACHAANAPTLARLGVTALLNVSRAAPPGHVLPGRLAYKCIPVDDTGSADIGTWFHDAIQFIDEVQRAGGKVLVHCHAGVSRSATICVAYLMSERRLRLDEAYDFVKQRRSIISPNFNFMGQLLSYDTQLFASGSAASGSSASGSGSSSSCTPPSPDGGATCGLSIVAVVAAAAAAAAHVQESRRRSAAGQRFVFDVDGAVVGSGSSSPLVSPMSVPSPILSPS